MFTNVLVIVKPADKTRRTYKRMISARLHRGFYMSRSLKARVVQDLSETKVVPDTERVYQQQPLLNVSSGEDAFIGEVNVFC